ncbi:MAG: hypothetical protein LBT37_00170 [Lactobacillaceae bacterium]|nr:hypothetical protein [Lactobacillaceae bacterium]
MKKIFVISIMTLVFASSFYTNAEAVTNGNGTANINVTAPSTNALYMTAYPSFDFGTAKNTVQQVVASGDQPYTIVDLRGGSSGFQIQAKISDFTIANNSAKKLPVIDFILSVADSTDGSVQGSSQINIFNQNGTVIRAGADTNGLNVSGGANATLNLLNKTGLSTGVQYNAIITHSLVAGI